MRYRCQRERLAEVTTRCARKSQLRLDGAGAARCVTHRHCDVADAFWSLSRGAFFCFSHIPDKIDELEEDIEEKQNENTRVVNQIKQVQQLHQTISAELDATRRSLADAQQQLVALRDQPVATPHDSDADERVAACELAAATRIAAAERAAERRVAECASEVDERVADVRVGLEKKLSAALAAHEAEADANRVLRAEIEQLRVQLAAAVGRSPEQVTSGADLL